MLRTAVVVVLSIMALSATPFPASKIIIGTCGLTSERLQFGPIVAAVAQVAQVSFGSLFTTLPKASVVYTGFERPPFPFTSNYGWIVTINSISLSGSTVSLLAVNSFRAVRLKYVATQGDHLQVFYLESICTPSNGWVRVPFDYANMVSFDGSKPPTRVFIAVDLTGYQLNYDSQQSDISISPIYFDG